MTQLPILKSSAPADQQTLIRLFHQIESDWTSHIAQPTPMDFGTAWCNPELAQVYDANRMIDVALPEGMAPDAAIEQATAFFESKGSSCWEWVMNPSAPAEKTQPMIERLMARGHARHAADIMYLDRLPPSLPGGSGANLKIIPARASFRHARQLHEQNAREWGAPQLADAEMLHLDDPHYDALIAIDADGTPAAHIGVLAMGEVGLIEQVYVSEPFRRRGIGGLMLGRAIEICARSLFKHVMLQVAPDHASAIGLYKKFGFRKVGEMVTFIRPRT